MDSGGCIRTEKKNNRMHYENILQNVTAIFLILARKKIKQADTDRDYAIINIRGRIFSYI